MLIINLKKAVIIYVSSIMFFCIFDAGYSLSLNPSCVKQIRLCRELMYILKHSVRFPAHCAQIVVNVRLDFDDELLLALIAGANAPLVGARARTARLVVFLKRQSCLKNGSDIIFILRTKTLRGFVYSINTVYGFQHTVFISFTLFCLDRNNRAAVGCNEESVIGKDYGEHYVVIGGAGNYVFIDHACTALGI